MSKLEQILVARLQALEENARIDLEIARHELALAQLRQSKEVVLRGALELTAQASQLQSKEEAPR